MVVRDERERERWNSKSQSQAVRGLTSYARRGFYSRPNIDVLTHHTGGLKKGCAPVRYDVTAGAVVCHPKIILYTFHNRTPAAFRLMDPRGLMTRDFGPGATCGLFLRSTHGTIRDVATRPRRCLVLFLFIVSHNLCMMHRCALSGKCLSPYALKGRRCSW